MGKSCGVAKRRRKNANPRFHHKSKFAKDKKKLILRQKVKDPLVRQGWDLSISKAKNLKEIGITDDPNKVIPIPKPIKGLLKPKQPLIVKVPPISQPKRKEVLEKIEERSKRKKPLTFHFGPNLVGWLTEMMSKHGDDYKAMERDPDNHYQHSAGFIRRKIKQFLTNPFTGEAYDKAMESLETDLYSDDDSKDETEKTEPEQLEEPEGKKEEEKVATEEITKKKKEKGKKKSSKKSN
ncbi:nucleolar protein 16-like [Panonychus citri]|uniref:nucleolar protein 16-like n=1 Tax=Panonychus citri TaxID=50023 RepID=UPI0023083264|nr:nucleolar protein 16-like [Panonychus citri]